ncbi:hypothetical protein [Lactococcus lactis]|uniref:Phage protein n=1 Tax=Lactococcus lactis subsp. lactis A12 TaxID=1137134 RepID=S6EZZ0_LACLL|nr:hypothetical protein [Lactococcus lactis]CDG04963.1 Putative uncharacterized protein, phage protein [Lactococcus lactis subsp. lactis A12]SBW30690.1 Putative uncharacterized protein, phage protein [Lactococcus lactis subsp. lactis]
MKKFELYSAEFINKLGKPKCVMSVIEANNYAEVIQELESNAGWYTGDNGAFKVAYIEEVVE